MVVATMEAMAAEEAGKTGYDVAVVHGGSASYMNHNYIGFEVHGGRLF